VDLGAGGSLPGAFRSAWAADPARVILSTLEGEAVTAAELEERTAAAAGRYAAAGLGPGDRVLISAGTSVALVVAYVGALRAGLTVVPANHAYPPAELAALVETARPAMAVLDDPSRVEGLAVTTPDLAALPTASTSTVLDTATSSDTALIIYTSGTTGRPKGVPLSHGNLLASAHAVRIAWRWAPDDHLALALPLFHVHGLGVGLHGTLVTGAQATLIPRFEPGLVASAITDAGGDDALRCAHHVPPAGRLPGSGRALRAAPGGERLGAAAGRAARGRSGPGSGQVVLERYGHDRNDHAGVQPVRGRAPSGHGRVSRYRAWSCGSRLGRAAPPRSRCAGPNIIDGYLDNPAATAEAFTADGWLRTGDLGTLDEDGYLRISGRAKELIITGGYNVYPREVEDVLLRVPGRRPTPRSPGSRRAVGRDRGSPYCGARLPGRRPGGVLRGPGRVVRGSDWSATSARRGGGSSSRCLRNALGKSRPHRARLVTAADRSCCVTYRQNSPDFS
jgi:malonyl-CoA/methylmalonyl-CoA synthetase